jgi:hypothetical protein
MGGDKVKQVHQGRSGIESEQAKKIQKLIKDSKLKVQAAIQGDAVRVTGAKRDDLQAAMALVARKWRTCRCPSTTSGTDMKSPSRVAALCLLWRWRRRAQTVTLQGMLGSKALLIVDGAAPRAVAVGETFRA